MKPFKIALVFAIIFIANILMAQEDAQKIIDAAIQKHGGEHYNAAKISFDFRGRHYIIERNSGLFTYKRLFTDSTGAVEDVLHNNGFYREIDGKPVELSDEWKGRYSNSVNSVAYFALLPFPLNDPAANKRYIGQATLKGQPYHKIEVTFQQEGGGKDYEDVFVYWIHQQQQTMDYLAYSFLVDDGGTRFREAMNPRDVNGIRFVNYVNYKGPKTGTPVAGLDMLFEAGKLEKASEIILENVQVELLVE